MLTKRHIEELNAPPPKGKDPVPYMAGGAALGALALFALGFLLLDSLAVGAGLAALALLAGGALVVARRRRDSRSRPIELHYGLMDNATSARFSRMQKAFEVLASAEKLWRVEEGEDGPQYRPVGIRLGDPPRIRTNVDVWGIDLGAATAYFLPEALILHEDGRYRAISYGTLRVEMHAEKVIEEGEVPSDAEVVGKTWRYLAENGTSPDRTRSFNPRLPQVVYGVVRLRACGWKAPDLWVSNEAAAAQFVLVFLAAGPDAKRADRRGTRPYADRTQADPAYSVLGLEEGAPRSEITAAYRRMARAYHPDKTRDFLPEFRALANRRMQEINAAYSHLRRGAT